MPAGKDGNYGQLATLGFEIAVGVGLGVVIGRWLDAKFGWSPWGTLVGGLLGMAAGMYVLIRDAIRMNKK